MWIMEAIILILFASILSKAKIEVLRNYQRLLTLFVLASIFYCMAYGFGLIDAYSFETAMLIFAILLPTYSVRHYLEYAAIGLFLFIAFKMGGSTGGILALIYFLGLVFYSKYTHLKIAAGLATMFGLVWAYKYTDLLSDSGRFKIWQQFINHWQDNFNMWIGSGIGTFKNISPFVHTPSGTLMYAHNDFLEIYLETGILGLTIFLALCYQVLKMAHKAKLGHIALMIFAFMFLYFPNQILLARLLFVFAITYFWYMSCYLKDSKQKS